MAQILAELQGHIVAVRLASGAVRGVLARGPVGVLEIAAEVDADPADVQRMLEELKGEGEVGRRPPGPEYPRSEEI